MYSSYNNSYNGYNMQPYSNDRLIGGGFLGPFLLGGLAGAAISPGFNRPYYNNYYYPYPVYYGPYRPYRPYRPY